MNITLFQIADVPLYLKMPMPSNFVVTGVLDDMTSAVTVSEKPLLFGNRVVYGERQFQQRPQSYTLEGDLYHTEAMDAAQFVGKLAEYEGLEVHLIGYLHHRGEAFEHPQRVKRLADAPSYGNAFVWGQSQWGVGQWASLPLTQCQLAGEGDLCAVQWVETTGVIKSVQVKPQRMGTPRVKIELSMQPKWQGLNPVFWEYKGGVIHHDVMADLICECGEPSYLVKPFPSCETLFNGVACGMGLFHRRVFDDSVLACLMQPDYWQVMVDGCPSPYPIGRALSNQTGTRQYDVYSYPDGFYNAPPSSMYQISNVQNEGVFRMEIRRKEGVWRVRTDVVEISIAEVNDALDLNGLAPIGSSDRLIWGDVLYRAGFVIRNGAVLYAGELPFRLPVHGDGGRGYVGAYAGELGVGNNHVTVKPPHHEVLYSALHMFGRIA